MWSATTSWALVMLAVAGVLQPIDAQSIQGHVLDELNDFPVATALVRLMDESGEQLAVTVADTSGFFVIEADAPGKYRLQAERIGYDEFETPLVEAGNPEGVYAVDLLMSRSPVPIPGFEITTERVDMQVKLLTGMHPNSLRLKPIRHEEIQDHVARAHDLTDMMRWNNAAGIIVKETPRGPCYQSVRTGLCLQVYLNGAPLSREMIPVVPLDMVHTAVVLYPIESILYPYGAVLLYTAAWIR